MKYKSFESFIGAFLNDCGFVPDGKRRWRKNGLESTMFIDLQRISFRPGFYINYGIAFCRLAKAERPVIDECIVDTDNPGLSREEKIRMLQLLDNTKELVAFVVSRLNAPVGICSLLAV